MGLDNDQQVFLTQYDQQAQECKQFQTKSGESFDFREGYDTTVYEVHKQYKLRSRTIDVPELTKPTHAKLPKKPNDKTVLTDSSDKKLQREVTVEDVSDVQPSANPSSTPFLSTKLLHKPLEKEHNSDIPHNSVPTQEKDTQNSAEKEKFYAQNIKIQVEKPFNLETEIGKLKIVIPLSKLAKHEVFRQKINRSLQVPDNRDAVNVFDDQLELIFGSEVNGKSVDGGIPPFYKLKQADFHEIIEEESEVIELKDNFLPTGLTPLEDIFDSNDIPKKPKMQPINAEIKECNIGTTENPKMIKLSRTLPPKKKSEYIELFKEFQDVFAWSYEDLKSYDTSIIQHTIPLKENQKPFKQKLRRVNPVLLPLIEKELKRMYEAGIIAPIRFSEWISNLVPTRKKIGEIRLCVDLRNLNKVSLKDHYPLPKMDHILQRVVGASRISLLDGFSRFNQILVHPDDQDKTAFTTPWGTFKYVKMPFGLKNAGATFQRAMDIAFAREIHEFLVIYLDDLTAFSKSDQEHLEHLRQVFLICRKYGISLNPKK
eukprot:PITA_02880